MDRFDGIHLGGGGVSPEKVISWCSPAGEAISLFLVKLLEEAERADTAGGVVPHTPDYTVCLFLSRV